MNEELKWFAVQTRSGAEQVAAETLWTLDLETFLPLARRDAKRGPILRPMFSGYLFARFEARIHLHLVRYSRGVLRVLGPPENPWSVDEAIIAEIRHRMDEHGAVDLTRSYRAGDGVRICEGPLAGWNGIFDAEVGDRIRVILLLDAIQQAHAIVPRNWLEAAEAV